MEPSYYLIALTPFVGVGVGLSGVPNWINWKIGNAKGKLWRFTRYHCYRKPFFQKARRQNIRTKPVDCAMCLSFWLCFTACIYVLYPSYNTDKVLFVISLPFASMTVAVYLDKLTNPFWK